MATEFDCQSAGMDCEFMVRSNDEDEVIQMVQQHHREKHDMDMSEEDVRDQMRAA